MRTEIARIHDQLDTTTIYVTHDQTEAMSMATRIVVMKDGYIQQVGSPEEIYDHPSNVFVANFIGAPPMNFFSGKLENGRLRLGRNTIEMSEHTKNLLKTYENTNQGLIIGIRPEAFSLNSFDNSDNYIEAKVINIEMLGDETIIYAEDKESTLAIDDEEGNSKVAIKVQGKCKGIETGDMIKLFVNFDDIHLFDSNTQMRIN